MRRTNRSLRRSTALRPWSHAARARRLPRIRCSSLPWAAWHAPAPRRRRALVDRSLPMESALRLARGRLETGAVWHRVDAILSAEGHYLDLLVGARAKNARKGRGSEGALQIDRRPDQLIWAAGSGRTRGKNRHTDTPLAAATRGAGGCGRQ